MGQFDDVASDTPDSFDGVVRDKAFWEKFEAVKLNWDGTPHTDWWDEDWEPRQAAHFMVRMWYQAENEFSTLEGYGLAQAKQLFYRLSYLDKPELEMLHRKYCRKAPQPVSDKDMAALYDMDPKQFREWRLSVVEKVCKYRSTPKKP
ncbi:hypothetical protein [Secundilactobacillus muriivasis]